MYVCTRAGGKANNNNESNQWDCSRYIHRGPSACITADLGWLALITTSYCIYLEEGTFLAEKLLGGAMQARYGLVYSIAERERWIGERLGGLGRGGEGKCRRVGKIPTYLPT